MVQTGMNAFSKRIHPVHFAGFMGKHRTSGRFPDISLLALRDWSHMFNISIKGVDTISGISWGMIINVRRYHF